MKDPHDQSPPNGTQDTPPPEASPLDEPMSVSTHGDLTVKLTNIRGIIALALTPFLAGDGQSWSDEIGAALCVADDLLDEAQELLDAYTPGHHSAPPMLPPAQLQAWKELSRAWQGMRDHDRRSLVQCAKILANHGARRIALEHAIRQEER